MPGRGLPPEGSARASGTSSTPYAGGTRMTIGPGSVATPGRSGPSRPPGGRTARCPGERLLEPAVEAAAGFPHGQRLLLLPVLRPRAGLRLAAGEPGRALRRRTAPRRPGAHVVVPAPRRHGAAAGRGRAPTRCTAASSPARSPTTSPPAGGVLTARGPRGVRRRRPPAARGGQRGLAVRDQPAARRRGCGGRRPVALLDGIPAGATWSPDELGPLPRRRRCARRRAGRVPDEAGRTGRARRSCCDRSGRSGRLALTSPSTATVSAVDDRAAPARSRSPRATAPASPSRAPACAQQLSRRAGAAAGRSAHPQRRDAAELEHGADGRPSDDRRRRARRSAHPARTASRPRSPRCSRCFTAGSDLHGAIAHPRMHVRVRPREDPPVLLDHEEDLRRPGRHRLPHRSMPPHSMYFGGVTAALWSPPLGLLASGDPRRAGAVAVHNG